MGIFIKAKYVLYMYICKEHTINIGRFPFSYELNYIGYLLCFLRFIMMHSFHLIVFVWTSTTVVTDSYLQFNCVCQFAEPDCRFI